MQKSKIAERNLNSQHVRNNAKNYNWPYSQPRIVNIVHATSRTGLLFGVLSSLLILNNGYFNNRFILIDLSLVLSFFLLRCIIIPMIRRATIKEVSSESRIFNKVMLIILCTLAYSGVVRFGISSVLYLKNNNWDFRNFILLLINNITPQILILGIILIILPTLLILYPKDVAIKEYHYQVRRMATQIPDIPEMEETPQYIPVNTRMPNMASASYSGKTYKPTYNGTATPISNNDSQRTPKKNNQKKKEQKKSTVSIWDADKSVRKPRK